VTSETPDERKVRYAATLRAQGTSDHVAASVAALWVEAEDPTTPGERVRVLAQHSFEVHRPVWEAARRNPGLPSDEIRRYAADGDLDVWCNPSLPMAILLAPGDWPLIGAERALERLLHGETWGPVRKGYVDLPAVARLLEGAVRWRTHPKLQVRRWQECLDAILAFVREGSGQGSPPAAGPPPAASAE
jgi:hypothetical protein